MTRTHIIRRLRRPVAEKFRPLSLTEVLLSLIGRRKHRQIPPANPNWEDDAPMSGLS